MTAIEPGTVLILLAGPYRGKRVVFLKKLASGPYKINGIPLRRVNRAYVIATSTKVDVSGVDTKKFDDSYFKKPKEGKKSGKKTDSEFFASADKKKTLSSQFVADQKAVDTAILAKLKKDGIRVRYLRARFTLTSGLNPHELKF